MRSRFRGVFLSVLPLALIGGLAAVAEGGVLFDGTGNPADDGFVYAGTGAPDSSAVFTFDSQGGAAGTAPGYLFQIDTPEGGAGGSYRFGSPTEFSRANGWTVEARLKINPPPADPNNPNSPPSTASGSTGDGFSMFMTLGDDVRGWLFMINPSRINTYYEGAPGGADGFRLANQYPVDMRDFHTLKWVQPAGGGDGSLQFYVDGILTGIATQNQAGSGTPGAFTDSSYQQEFQFFNNGGPGGAAGIYDFIAINTTAPEIPLGTIGVGVVDPPNTQTVIKGGVSGNLQFSIQNTASLGAQSITTTSITPEPLAGTTYSAIPNVGPLGAGVNGGYSTFTATTSNSTPAGAHVLNPTIQANATNSPFTAGDAVSPTLIVQDHSNGSFESASDVNEITINFGNVVQGSGSQPGGFEAILYDIFNLEETVGFTAALELYPDGISATGDTSVLFLVDGPADTDVQFQGLSGGDSVTQAGVLDTNAPLGSYSATWTLAVEDHNAIPGNIANATALKINLVANIVVPEPCTVGLLAVGLVGLVAMKRRRA